MFRTGARCDFDARWSLLRPLRAAPTVIRVWNWKEARMPRKKHSRRWRSAMRSTTSGQRGGWDLSRFAGEGVARVQGARVQAAPEPEGALLGRAVGEGVRRDIAAGPHLETVVADRARRVQRLLHVAGLQHPSRFRVVRPDAGEAVRLQLLHHGKGVPLGLPPAGLRRSPLPGGAD